MECDEAKNGLRMVDLQVRRVVESGLYDEISFPTRRYDMSADDCRREIVLNVTRTGAII
jgi:hypothetical protein